MKSHSDSPAVEWVSASSDPGPEISVHGYRYQAFLSYSHRSDGRLAPVLQSQIESFDAPWYSRRRRVFRDTASLGAGPHLWKVVEEALGSSAWFILLASPEAVESAWVRREVDWWLDNRSVDTLLIGLTSGSAGWAPTGDGVGGDRPAVPSRLLAALPDEPRWVDLRWVLDEARLDKRDPRLQDGVADFASAISGVPKDVVFGEHLRRRRQARHLVAAALAVLVAALAVAGVQWHSAADARREAQARQLVARADALAASSPELAALLVVQAYRMAPVDDVRRGVVAAVFRPLKRILVGHQGPIAAATFSADGLRLLTQANDGAARLWDTRSGRPVTRFPTGRAVMTRDGATVATVAIVGDVARLQLWDGRTGRYVTDLGHGRVNRFDVALAFDPSGRYVAVAWNLGLEVWDVAARSLVRSLPLEVTALAWSARRDRLVVGGSFGLQWWDVRTGGLVAAEAKEGFHNPGLTVSPDGGRVVTTVESETRLRDASTGAGGPALGPGHASHRALAFSGDGTRLATEGTDGSVALWDARSGRLTVTLKGRNGAVNAAAFTADGSRVVTGGADGSIRIWNANTGAELNVLTQDVGEVSVVAVSPDGAQLVTGGTDGLVRVWDLWSGQERSRLVGAGGDATAVRFTPAGDRIVAASRTAAHAWDLSGRLLRTFGETGHGVHAAARVELAGLAIDPKGTRVATGDTTGAVTVWDLPTGRRIGTLTDLAGPAVHLRFSPDGSRLFAGSERAGGVLWDTRTLRLVARLVDGLLAYATFVGDGSLLTVRHPGTVHVWNGSTGRAIAELPTGDHVGALAVDKTGDRLVIATAPAIGDGVVQLWDMRRRTLVATLNDIGRTPVLVFDPAGDRLVTVSGRALLVWDATSGRRITTMLAAEPPLTLTFSPDGGQLASGGSGGIIQLWDPRAATLVTSLHSLGGSVEGLAFSPDGTLLAAAGAGGPRLYQAVPEIEDAIGRICAAAGRELTSRELSTFLPDGKLAGGCSRP